MDKTRLMADGGSYDFARGGHGSTYEPVTDDRLLYNGDTMRSGDKNSLCCIIPGIQKVPAVFYLIQEIDKDLTEYLLPTCLPSLQKKVF